MFPKGLYIVCVVMGNRAALMGLYKTYKGLYVIKYKEFFCVALFVYIRVCKIINENHVS